MMSLNFVQKNAVKFTSGPCLILAGAGSGKTKVIIKKIIYLIQKCHYEPKNIIAVTFTNKAAHEIRMRLLKHLNSLQIRDIIISTFHSLGLEIIKKEIIYLNFNLNFSIFDEQDQINLIKKLIKKNIKNDIFFLKKLIFMISYWKNKFLTPLKARSLASSHEEKNFADLYKKYTTYLNESNILDFDDLICIPTQLLKKNKTIRDRWQNKILYLLVDEYQDTNNSQYELIKILTNMNSNFTLVGDDDQSIYSWRGAKPQNIFFLKKDFPALTVIKMEQNYRSYGRILKAANKLISNNSHYFKKNLFSTLKYGNKIKIIIAENEEIEAEKIAKKIIYQNFFKKIPYEDHAILYRGKYQSQILEKIFLKKNVPYVISNHTSFFSRPEIRILLNYLRVITNPNDNYAFLKIINTPHRGIGLVTLNKLEQWSIQNKKNLFEASKNIKIKEIFSIKTFKKIENFISWMQKKIETSYLNPSILLSEIIADTKYISWLSKTLKEPKRIQLSIDNIKILSNWLKEMLKGNDCDKPLTLLQIMKKIKLQNIVDHKIKNNNLNQVKLMTLHASKGLEFPSVFIIGMNEGILPNIKSINNNDIEEERRLTYVGMTRAKKQLFFTLCQKRIQYGQIMNTVPSRFLFELPEEDIEWDQKYIRDKNSYFF